MKSDQTQGVNWEDFGVGRGGGDSLDGVKDEGFR